MIERIWHWLISVIMVLGLLLFVNSCASSKKSTSKDSEITGTSREIAATGGEIIGITHEPYGWTSVSMPVSVDLDKPLSLSASGRASMVRDSIVHISIRFIGMEVGVIRATTDSVFLVDKYHKRYFAESLPKLLGNRGKNLSLGDLQDMALGLREIPEGLPATVTLSKITDTPAGEAAGTVDFKASADKINIDGALEWNLKSARWNTTPVEIPQFSIPRGAKRIALESLKNISF